MKWKGFYYSIYGENTPTTITIKVNQLHAAILWHIVEMQLSAFDISALAYLRIQ